MFTRLKKAFQDALRTQSESDFLSIPPKEVLDELQKQGWRFTPRNPVPAGRYAPPPVTAVFNIHSPQGKKLQIGKNPDLWQQYQTARKRAYNKAFG